MHALNPWIPVAVQAGVGILSIAGSGVVVHWLNTRKERKEFHREKLEDLSVAVGEFLQTLEDHDDVHRVWAAI
jgi:hypothetical protein